MSKNIIKFSFVFLGVFLISCSSITEFGKKQNITIQAGMNKGGIVENTDMSVIHDFPSNSEIDAYSGATTNGFNVGVHSGLPLKRNEIEYGIDFINSNQTFTFHDNFNSIFGERSFSLNQLLIPLTYNFKILPLHWQKLDLQLKVGIVGQFNLAGVKSEGDLYDYSINTTSGGFTFGLSFYVLKFKNKSKLGVFADAYRGSQIYSDYYNQKGYDMPGSAYAKFGLKFKF